MKQVNLSRFWSECEKLGLCLSSIQEHYKKIRACLSEGNKIPSFKVLDTCRLDNKRILSIKNNFIQTETDKELDQGFVALVPAAGASSRFIKPFSFLLKALKESNYQLVKEEKVKLEKYLCLLPAETQKVLTDFCSSQESQMMRELAFRLMNLLSLPKAFWSYNSSGVSFLQKKRIEHLSLKNILGEVYISPYKRSVDFERYFAKKFPSNNDLDTYFLEQGPKLSTIRIGEDALPLGHADASPSLVPAGHGTLLKLFPQIKKHYSTAHSLFIRNIDNASHEEEGFLKITESFFSFHELLLINIQKIRFLLRENLWDQAARKAKELLIRLQLSKLESNSSLAALESLQEKVFQTKLPEELKDEDKKSLLKTLFQRPLNTLAQVPNLGNDIGGQPVILDLKQVPTTVCVELAHIDEADQDLFFKKKKLSTHFNPVFVAAELVSDISSYEDITADLWLLAKKSLHGDTVYYHETALYELLGNSKVANACFLELPRLIFNPHKSLDDCLI